ncbi:MAG: ATP-binding protein, partial [Treponema sp.]|nr:ATP-binding protein [Treponema sp.]
LNSIIGFSELAMDSDIKPETKDYLEKIIDNSNWLLDIINDVLDISKIESGKMELECVPFDLHDIFTQCQTLFMEKANKNGLVLHFYAEPTIGKKLLGDPTKLRQIYTNLLSNAVKFTNVGTIKLSSFVVNSDSDTCTVCFEIRDSGIGMTPEQIAKIFMPFTQADASMTRKHGGTGLGLSITKNLIELMGGRLIVESTPKVGSKFSFEIKFKTIDIPENKPSQKAAAETIKKPAFNGEVLICEDNVMNQRVICEHLWRTGLSYELAVNGKEAIDIVRKRKEAGEKPFDLILMDIHMPIMDGLEATPKIIELNTGTPIVAMTANIMTDDIHLYEKIGMPDCISKPFTSQDLWACLLKYFKPLDKTEKNESENIIADLENDEEFQKQLLFDFVKYNRSKAHEIKDALNSGDITLAHRLAHSLKNNAAQIQKTELQKAAADAERLLQEGKNLLTKELLNLLESELNASIKTIEREIIDRKTIKPVINTHAGQAQQEAQPEIHNKEKQLEILQLLEPLLKCGSIDCLQYINDLQTISGSEELIEHINELNFRPAALESLGRLKLKLEEK